MAEPRVFAPWDVEGSNRFNRHAASQEWEIECYRTDAIVVRTYEPKGLIDCDRSKRGTIGKTPSSSSLKRLVFILNNADVCFCSMLTLTITPEINCFPVDQHRKSLKAALEKLRREGVNAYCWVREFQENGSVHWHVFTDLHVQKPGAVNVPESVEWSTWWATYWRKLGGSFNCFRKMKEGDGKGFRCCRFEQLQTNAGGRYAAKEGAKRFQKIPPKRWVKNGGAWWRASRGLTCTPIKSVKVSGDSLNWAQIKLPSGQVIDTPLKLQFSRGLNECSKS